MSETKLRYENGNQSLRLLKEEALHHQTGQIPRTVTVLDKDAEANSAHILALPGGAGAFMLESLGSEA